MFEIDLNLHFSVHIQINSRLRSISGQSRFPLRKCLHSLRSISDSFRSISDSFRSISVRIRAFKFRSLLISLAWTAVITEREPKKNKKKLVNLLLNVLNYFTGYLLRCICFLSSSLASSHLHWVYFTRYVFPPEVFTS